MNLKQWDKMVNAMLILYPTSFLVNILTFTVGPNDPLIVKAIAFPFAFYFRFGFYFLFFAIWMKIGIYFIRKKET